MADTTSSTDVIPPHSPGSTGRHDEPGHTVLPGADSPDGRPPGGNGPAPTTEETRTAANEYRRALFNNLHDAIFIHDLNGRVIDVNEKMLEMYRMKREEAIGLSILPDYSSSGQSGASRATAVLCGKRSCPAKASFFEWKARRPRDGSIFDVEVSLTEALLARRRFYPRDYP